MNKRRNTEYIIFNITCGDELGSLIVEGRKKFRLSIPQFMFMSMMTRHELKKLETGKTDTILNKELRSICIMLDIEYRHALELTECPPSLIEQLVNERIK